MEYAEKEVWGDIDGYGGVYQISNLGTVKSFKKNAGGRILKLNRTRNGYLVIGLKVNKTQRVFHTVHTLVWDAFGDGNRDGYRIQVDHINNIRDDNRISNLQLLTCRQNHAKIYSDNNIKKVSKYIGVTWDKRREKWRSVIWVSKRSINLGHFSDEAEASQAYQRALSRLDSIPNNGASIREYLTKFAGYDLT